MNRPGFKVGPAFDPSPDVSTVATLRHPGPEMGEARVQSPASLRLLLARAPAEGELEFLSSCAAIAAEKCGTSRSVEPESRTQSAIICSCLGPYPTTGSGRSQARVLQMQAHAGGRFGAGIPSQEHCPFVRPAVQTLVRRSSKVTMEVKLSMSSSSARISSEAARAGGREALLELLAPDRKPLLQPYGHAEDRHQPRPPQTLNKELVSARSDR